VANAATVEQALAACGLTAGRRYLFTMLSVEPDLFSTFRRLLLALVLLGIGGLTLELLLLEHTESATQWIPFAVLALGLIVGVAAWIRPSARILRLLQIVMLLFIVAGLLGIYLHVRGNVLFEQETDPSARGLDLIWRSLYGGIPMLAPAAMTHVGLLGLLFAYRHPALRRREASTIPQERS
jgi:hypothetical protein